MTYKNAFAIVLLKNNLFRTIIAFLFFIFVHTDFIAQKESLSGQMLDSLLTIRSNPGYEILIDRLEDIKIQSVNDLDTLIYVKCLQYQCTFYSRLSDYANFSRVVRECNNILKDSSLVPLSTYIASINNSASLEKIKGNHKKANELYLTILKLEKNNQRRPKNLTRYYYNQSLNYISIGDFKRALTTIEQSINYSRGIDTHKGQIIKGNIHYELKESDNAIKSLLLGLQSLEKPQYSGSEKMKIIISGYQDLVKVYIQLGQILLAEQAINRVNSYQEILPYRIYKTRELEGQLLTAGKQYELAIPKFKDALTRAESKYKSSKEYPVIERLYRELGDSYVSTGNIDTALTIYQRGLKYFDNELELNIKYNPNIEYIRATNEGLDLLEAKAKAAKIKYLVTESGTDFSISYNAYESAISLIDKMKADFLTEDSKFFVVKRSNRILDEALDLITKKYLSSRKPSLLNEIFILMEKNKGSILFQSIKQKFDLLQSSLPSSIIEKESDLKLNISFQSKLLAEEEQKESPDSTIIKDLTKALYNSNELYAMHRQIVSKDYREYYSFTESYNREKSIKEVQNNIDKETAIIEYYSSNKYLYSLTIRRNSTHLKILPFETIYKEVQKYQNLISKKPESKSSITELQQFSSILSKRLLDHIPLQDIKSIIIIPDGILSQIPFESLYWGDKNKYLIEDFNVTYQYSTKQYLDTRKWKNSNNNVLCLAPQFGQEESETRSCNNENLGNLKFAKEEVEYISENYDSKLITSDVTNIKDLTDNINNYGIIHLATHACLNVIDPMLSEIHFNDGTLTNYEIQNLNSSPELVVLSACNTGQGEVLEGEGIISLARGFIQAGVQSVQSSLWPLDDYSSSEIVKQMYTNLKKGQKKSEALRNSKLEYISKADKLHKHPYFWAGIVHVGDDSPLFSSFNYNYILLLLGVSILAIALFFYSKKSKAIG